jgi:phospholipid transport system substrate-binding protein
MALSRLCRSIAVALALLWGVSAAGVWAAEPTDAVRDFFGAVNLVLADPRTEDQPVEKLRAIRDQVGEVFDFREAAVLALGREWSARTAVEQTEFVALFAHLLERSFVWRVAGKASIGGGVQVQYLGETVAGDTATVDTAVAARDGNDLRLEYRMVRRADRWVVRDVIMDGVSTMQNYHAQFQRVVRDSSWRELMGQLRAKVGAPPVGVQVAAPVPPVIPLTFSAALLVAPLAAPAVDRPVPPERHAVARDLAVIVTPGLAVRDASPLPAARQRTAPPVLEALPTSPPGREPALAPPLDAGPPGVLQSDGAAPRPPHVDTAVEPRAQVGPSAASWWIQVGAFRNPTIARRIAERVKGKIFVVAAEGPAGGQGKPLLRVRVGPFNDRAQVVSRLRELKALGYQPFVASN